MKNLTDLSGVGSNDDILEFGCGVARIGLELAPGCRTWTGADLSVNLLTTAAERLRGVANVRLVKLQQVGLAELETDSFDLVCFHQYARSSGRDGSLALCARRLSRASPGGRLFIDNVDLESDEGWEGFSRGTESSQELERPPYQPTPSTGAELTTYAKRAGFEHIQTHKRAPLVIVTAVKPGTASQART